MAATVVDDRNRIRLPEEVVVQLDLKKGDLVLLERVGDEFRLRKTTRQEDPLRRIADQDPKRSIKVKRFPTSKEIWRVQSP